MRQEGVGYRQIAATLRKQWLAEWQPGKQLPSYAETQGRLGCALKTLQQAMSLLIDQGWVTAKPKVGTRLAVWPPNECRIGLLLPGHKEEDACAESQYTPHHTRRLEAIRLAAERFNGKSERFRIDLYPDMEQGNRMPGSGWRRLARDMEDGALYGAIWSWSHGGFSDEPLLRAPPVPMVFHDARLHHPDAWTASVRFNHNSWDIMGKWLLRQGFDRAAAIAIDTLDTFTAGEVRATLESTGLKIPPGWLLGANPFRPDWVREIVRALFDRPVQDRPRALMVTDDHLLERVAEELAACGAVTALVGLWNHPIPCGVKYPVWLCEMDACRWLEVAVERLREMRTAGSVAERDTLLLPGRDAVFLGSGEHPFAVS